MRLERPPARLPRLSAGTLLALVWLAVWTAGCSDDAGGGGGDSGDEDAALDLAFDVRDDGPDASRDADARPDGDALADASDDAGCAGSPPMCTHGCGGDFFEAPDCIGGEWICPPDTTPIDDCPPGSCFGMPLEGEVCDGGWQCRPWETGALDDCPVNEFLCADCGEFDAPRAAGDCTCSCDAGYVTCAGDECAVTATSDLAGVTLRLLPDQCAYTLAEVAAGIELRWEVIVEEAVANVVPAPQDAGSCGLPGESGLIVFPRIDGDGQAYCRCDVGLCMGEEHPTSLTPGTYAGSFEWTGRNWDGPSDTGNPLGEPFPAGTYTVRVSAIGRVGDADDAPTFELVSTMPLTLLP